MKTPCTMSPRVALATTLGLTILVSFLTILIMPASEPAIGSVALRVGSGLIGAAFGWALGRDARG
jgi:hypothetical protein